LLEIFVCLDRQTNAKIPPIKANINPIKNPPPLKRLITEKIITNIALVLIFPKLLLLIKIYPTITMIPDITLKIKNNIANAFMLGDV